MKDFLDQLSLLEEKNPSLCFLLKNLSGARKRAYFTKAEFIYPKEKRSMIFLGYDFKNKSKNLLELLELGNKVIVIAECLHQVKELIQTSFFQSLMKHPSFFLYSTFQMDEEVCLKISWESLFDPIEFFFFSRSAALKKIKEKLLFFSSRVFLTFSEYKDFGAPVFKNIVENIKHLSLSKFGRSLSLENIPVLLCGASPSIQSYLPFIKKFHDKALIIAGGGAVEYLVREGVFVDIAAFVDPTCSKERFEMTIKNQDKLVGSVFYSLRCSSLLLQNLSQQKFVFEGSGESLFEEEIWRLLSEEKNFQFESGWNVGNFIAATACSLKASSLFLIGLEGTHMNDLRYPSKEIEDKNDLNRGLLDLEVGKEFYQELALKFPSTEFVFLDQTTLESSTRVLEKKKEIFDKSKFLLNEKNFPSLFHFEPIIENFYKEIKTSFYQIKRCLKEMLNEGALKNSSYILYEYEIENELFYKLILDRVWEVWRGILLGHSCKNEKEKFIKKSLFLHRVCLEYDPIFSDKECK